MGAALTYLATLETTECGVCGLSFAMPALMLRKQRELGPKAQFYCPAGHSLCFPGETQAEKLQRALEQERKRREQAEDLARRRGEERDQLVKTKAQTLGKLRAIKQRVKNGVCPCCHRSFVQLARHMATKHPEFNAEGES